MSISEESKGLWANIRAKRARGEKPARKGSEAYKKAVAAAKKINAQNEEVMDNKTPSTDMNYNAVNRAMSQDSMYEDEPSQTTTYGSIEAMPIGFYESTMCNRCATALLEDIKSGKIALQEAEVGGKKVQLGKVRRTPGGPKKFSVYVKNDKGNVVKVNFGDPGLSIKRDQPERKKAYRARHHCDNPGPRWKANYWSCRNWSSKPVSKIAEDSKLGVITGTQEKELNAGLRKIHMKQADFRHFPINDKTPHSKINLGGCGAFAKLLYYNIRKYLNITPEIVCLDLPDHQIEPGEINDYKSVQAYNDDGNMCIHLLLRIGDYYIDSSGIHKFSWYENQVYHTPLAIQEGMTIQTLTSWVASANSWNPTFNRYTIGDINKDMVKVLKVVKKAGIKK